MTDRELLEAAAKAAGMSGWRWSGSGMSKMLDPSRPTETGSIGADWNPLLDDGDALRLVVGLGLAVIPYPIYAKPKHSVISKQYDHARYLRGESEDVRICLLYTSDAADDTRCV